MLSVPSVVLLVLLIVSVIVNIVLLIILLSKNHVFSTLRKAVTATFGRPVTYQLVDLPKTPSFQKAYSREMALFGSALLQNFAVHSDLPGALTYLTFAGARLGALLLWQSVLWIIFRGTRTQAEFAADMRFQQRDHVHTGFLDVFEEIVPSLRRAMSSLQVREAVVCGHSLGAAVATLVLRDLSSVPELSSVGYAFGSPRVGDTLFATTFTPVLYNIMNADDIITDVPLAVMPNPRKPAHPLLYQHVGTEIAFRVNKGSWFQNHALTTYREFLERHGTKLCGDDAFREP